MHDTLMQVDYYRIEIRAVSPYVYEISSPCRARAQLPPLPDVSTVSRTLKLEVEAVHRADGHWYKEIRVEWLASTRAGFRGEGVLPSWGS